MDLTQQFTFTFTVKDVVCMQLFFKQGLSKLGNGAFRDEVENLKNRFDEALMRSRLAGVDENKPF